MIMLMWMRSQIYSLHSDKYDDRRDDEDGHDYEDGHDGEDGHDYEDDHEEDGRDGEDEVSDLFPLLRDTFC